MTRKLVFINDDSDDDDDSCKSSSSSSSIPAAIKVKKIRRRSHTKNKIKTTITKKQHNVEVNSRIKQNKKDENDADEDTTKRIDDEDCDDEYEDAEENNENDDDDEAEEKEAHSSYSSHSESILIAAANNSSNENFNAAADDDDVNETKYTNNKNKINSISTNSQKNNNNRHQTASSSTSKKTMPIELPQNKSSHLSSSSLHLNATNNIRHLTSLSEKNIKKEQEKEKNYPNNFSSLKETPPPTTTVLARKLFEEEVSANLKNANNNYNNNNNNNSNHNKKNSKNNIFKSKNEEMQKDQQQQNQNQKLYKKCANKCKNKKKFANFKLSQQQQQQKQASDEREESSITTSYSRIVTSFDELCNLKARSRTPIDIQQSQTLTKLSCTNNKTSAFSNVKNASIHSATPTTTNTKNALRLKVNQQQSNYYYSSCSSTGLNKHDDDDNGDKNKFGISNKSTKTVLNCEQATTTTTTTTNVKRANETIRNNSSPINFSFLLKANTPQSIVAAAAAATPTNIYSNQSKTATTKTTTPKPSSSSLIMPITACQSKSSLSCSSASSLLLTPTPSLTLNANEMKSSTNYYVSSSDILCNKETIDSTSSGEKTRKYFSFHNKLFQSLSNYGSVAAAAQQQISSSKAKSSENMNRMDENHHRHSNHPRVDIDSKNICDGNRSSHFSLLLNDESKKPIGNCCIEASENYLLSSSFTNGESDSGFGVSENRSSLSSNNGVEMTLGAVVGSSAASSTSSLSTNTTNSSAIKFSSILNTNNSNSSLASSYIASGTSNDYQESILVSNIMNNQFEFEDDQVTPTTHLLKIDHKQQRNRNDQISDEIDDNSTPLKIKSLCEKLFAQQAKLKCNLFNNTNKPKAQNVINDKKFNKAHHLLLPHENNMDSSAAHFENFADLCITPIKSNYSQQQNPTHPQKQSIINNNNNNEALKFESSTLSTTTNKNDTYTNNQYISKSTSSSSSLSNLFLTVLFDYESANNNNNNNYLNNRFSVKKGELVKVLRDYDDYYYLVATLSTNRVGFIPKECTVDLNEMRNRITHRNRQQQLYCNNKSDSINFSNNNNNNNQINLKLTHL